MCSIDYVITVVPIFSLLLPSTPYLPSFQQPPYPLSSYPRVVQISSHTSPFPILFLTSPCLFCTYQLCFLIPAPFTPFSPFPLPADNPPNDLHFCACVPVLVVCLVCFCFLGSVVDSCESVPFLMIVLTFFIFSNKSL